MTLVHVEDVPIAKQLYDKIANSKQADKAQLFFFAEVLNKYCDLADYKLIRTDTSGRISKRGSWSLDFGISGENDSIIHIPVEGFVHRIPETERSHWLGQMALLPVSVNFLKGLIRPGCIDDGPIRDW